MRRISPDKRPPALIRPERALRRVVLPAPEGPIIAIISPDLTEPVRPDRMVFEVAELGVLEEAVVLTGMSKKRSVQERTEDEAEVVFI